LYFNVGEKLSNASSYPKWREGNEFKSIREETATLRK
jgi:hypothetical protein